LAARFIPTLNVRLDLRDGKANAPRPVTALNKNAGATRVVRDHPAPPRKDAHSSPQPRAEPSDAGAIKVLRDDKMLVEDQATKQPSQADIGSDASPAKPRKRRRHPDDPLSNNEIIAVAAAVIVVSFTFTALLPSLLTRPGGDSTEAIVTLPASVQRPQSAQLGATTPALERASVQLRGSAGPTRASGEPTTVARTAPVLNEKARAPSNDRAKGEGLVPSSGQRTETGRIALTAAEKAAVTRGVKELENTAAIEAPRRPAPALSALTEAEKAAVERGLRELEKAAGESKP
jgi:hypothetical protein